MRPKCDRCGAQGFDGQVYARESIPFRSSKQYCPRCHTKFYERVYLVVFAISVLFGISGFATLAVNPASETARIFASGLLLLIFVSASVLPHELGHAFAARLLGFDVQKVLVGFGQKVLGCRLFGFDIEFKLLPFSGLCFVAPRHNRFLLARYFAFYLAGPATNLVFAAYFGVAATLDISFQSATASAAARLLGFANLVLAAESLLPFVFSSSYGRLLSDGLALFQILFLRQVPHAPDGKPNASRLRRIVLQALKWLGITFLVLCFGVCIALALLMFAHPGAARPERLWLVAVVLLGLAAAFGWAIYRVWQIPVMPTAAFPSETVTGNTSQALSNRLALADPHHRDPQMTSLAQEVLALMKNGRWDDAEQNVRAALVKYPDSLLLQLARAETLRDAGRLKEAEEQYEILLRDFDPGVEIRIGWTHEHLKAVICQQEYERARVLAEQAINEMISTEHKVRLLDRLACLPIMDGLRDYLDEAYKWCEQALQLAPDNLTLLGTKGSLLVELGRAAEGVFLLEKVYNMSEAGIDKGISAFYLALAASSGGDRVAAKRWADEAKKWFPEAWLLERLEQARIG